MLQPDENIQDSVSCEGNREGEKGWAAFAVFKKDRPAFTPTHVIAKKDFSWFTKLLIFLIPMLFFAAFYQYSTVWGSSTFIGKFFSSSAGVDLESNLVAHWTFDGPTVTDKAYDRIGSYHGSFGGGTLNAAKADGLIGQSLVFDGVDDILYIPELTTGTTFTIVAWIRPEGQIANWGQIIGRDESNCFEYQKGGLLLMNFSGGYNNSNTVMPDSEWHQVGMVVSSGDGIYYLNGNPDGTKNSIGSTGYTAIGSNGAEPFKGRIDELRFYNRALSDEEMKAIYKMTKQTVVNTDAIATGSTLTDDLVGHWTFDGQDTISTTATDVSGNGNNGTLTNGPTKVIGKLGQGLSFDGVNDYVSASTSLSFSSAASLSFWMKTPPVTTHRGVIAWTGGAAAQGMYIHYENASTIRLYFVPNDWGDGSLFADITDVDDNSTWSFWTVTLDEGTMTMYKQGVLVDTNSYTSIDKVLSRIGHYQSVGYFNGLIDDVRIYNRALTADEVRSLYEAGGGSVIQGGLVCGASTVEDSDGNVYDTVKIGQQCWMKQNMRVGTRINAITPQTNNATIEKHCYDDTLANCMTSNNPNHPDGGLYQWNEAMQYVTTAGAQGICPTGWHIPTHNEFTTLERSVCTTGTCATDFPYDTTTTGYRGTTEGTELKPNGTSLLEANLAGVSYGGSFDSRATYGWLWSSSVSGEYSWFRSIYSANTQIERNTDDKARGLSVRCLQD